jgi:hypothetical protein
MCEASKNADDGSWTVFEVGMLSDGRADRKGLVRLDATCQGILSGDA